MRSQKHVHTTAALRNLHLTGGSGYLLVPSKKTETRVVHPSTSTIERFKQTGSRPGNQQRSL